MPFRLATTALFFGLASLALARPSSPLDLTIPASDIAQNNMSAYLDHPLYSKYQTWLDGQESIKELHGNVNLLDNHPTFTGIVCDTTHDGCLLASSIILQTGHGLANTTVKRANANKYIINTHWKTYFDGDNGGDEHYTAWDLQCHRLTYHATRYVVATTPPSFDFHSSNNLDVSAYVYIPGIRGREVQLLENFQCSVFGNQCCNYSHDAKNAGSGNMNRYTWECGGYNQAYACQG
ncbi:hypothetical protein F4677DRAFT_461839 [Hypoxylon crocopeplum]|nr:hypothetical protein F4677DRAFT_461839 [Hypoxylon crocopeplum]